MATTDDTRLDDRSTQQLLGAGSTALAAIAMIGGAGLPGALAGVALLAAWVLAPAVYAFAIGHLLLLGIEPAVPTLVIAEGGLLGLLAASLPRPDVHTVGAFAVAFVGLLGVLRAVESAVDALWLVALVLVGSVALLAYALHRYELVRFGLVEATS